MNNFTKVTYQSDFLFSYAKGGNNYQKKVNPFCKTAAWLKCREVALIRDNFLCQPCFKNDRLVSAEIVHHIKELERYPELGLSLDNLESVCTSCHNKLHREKGKGNKLERKMRMTTVIEVKANIERL